MKYYIIVGEASGDLHASHLMRALMDIDVEAEFRFFGGDMMSAVGGERVKHYRELAYMGFIPVLLHLPAIFRNMALCKKDIVQWNPDVVILVDYPGFNLSIAKYVRSHTSIPVYYYISPKIWAWKEYRIKNIKRDVKEMFSILPFEIPFYETKHKYPIHYVGNPTQDEVNKFLSEYKETFDEFCIGNRLKSVTYVIDKENVMPGQTTHLPTTAVNTNIPIIALLAGSRRQEIKDNLPAMIEATRHLQGTYQIVLAGAPGIPVDYYRQFVQDTGVKIVFNKTYQLLAHATAALVTSGTATLETALFNVPQVVCYETPIPKVIAFLRKHLIKVKYISLVNLIADKEVVTELVADTFTIENIKTELESILPGGDRRDVMLAEYAQLRKILGNEKAPDNAAGIMYRLLTRKNEEN